MKEHTVTPLGARKSLWGEGPVWWDERLLYVDIEGHRLVRLDPETGVETVWDVGERIGCVVPRTTGGYVYAGDAGINTFNPATGEKANLADPEAAKRPDNRFNDGKCDPAGRFWAGTISTVKKTGDAALYMLETDGTLVTKIHHLTNSNGICWSRDAKTMYHIDTPTKKVLAYDFSLATGEITNPKEVVNTAAAGLDGSPDGMTLDAENRLW
ncbi:MAG: SMP-30/gluconolactonase/LRE family protein, partial [Opitutales bacterium]